MESTLTPASSTLTLGSLWSPMRIWPFCAAQSRMTCATWAFSWPGIGVLASVP
jgi:hypothetical protein